MKLTASLLLIAIASQCFSKNEIAKQQTISSEFYRFKKVIDSRPASDTIFANKCSIKVVDTAGIDVDSAYAKNANGHYSSRFEFVTRKLLKDTVVPCKGQYLWIRDYSNVTVIFFDKSNSVRFIGQSSHDENILNDFMMLKFSDSLYAYANEHICGMASIKYINDSITAKQLLLGEITDGEWNIVEIKRGKAVLTDYQKAFGK